MIPELLALAGAGLMGGGILWGARLNRRFWEAQKKVEGWGGDGPDPLLEAKKFAGLYRHHIWVVVAGCVLTAVGTFFLEAT